jgi:hypothetical protein
MNFGISVGSFHSAQSTHIRTISAEEKVDPYGYFLLQYVLINFLKKIGMCLNCN